MNFSRKKIIEYSKKYDAKYKGTHDELTEKELRDWFARYGYLDREHFIKLGLWKSTRPKKKYENKENDNLTIKEITKFALGAKSEIAKIKSLMILKGVSWPVASVILHFAFSDKYPILDFRVLWSLSKLFKFKQSKNYTFDFWKKYVQKLRKLAREHKVSLRTLDKALWYYSKEKQK